MDWNVQPAWGWVASPPGASMTPLRLTNSDTISLLITAPSKLDDACPNDGGRGRFSSLRRQTKRLLRPAVDIRVAGVRRAAPVAAARVRQLVAEQERARVQPQAIAAPVQRDGLDGVEQRRAEVPAEPMG